MQSINGILCLLGVFFFLCCESDNDLVAKNEDVSNFDVDCLLNLDNPVSAKNFYLLEMILQNQQLKETLQKEQVLIEIASAYQQKIESAINNVSDLNAVANSLLWSTINIAKVSDVLRLQSKYADGSLKKIIDGHFRPSGAFYMYSDLPDDEFIVKAWTDAANGINNILRTYAMGIAPRYPDIDALAYDINSTEYQSLVRNQLLDVSNNISGETLFFEAILKFSIGLLRVNMRDEAGRFEPLISGENKKAVEKIKDINWEDYSYSAIIVPGDAPENGDLPIENLGLHRLQLAVERYNKGFAPLIIVSGGNVKPFQTPYNEAFEMKKVLMQQHQIPESAIIIEPHARHTTTNLRNASRLIFRYGIPAMKKVLITTDKGQSSYITSDKYHNRCIDELGYLPVSIESRYSDYDIEIFPEMNSLHFDSKDPLDP